MGSGSPDDFGNFGLAMVTLSKSWFMGNADTWIYFNSNDSNGPEELEGDDEVVL